MATNQLFLPKKYQLPGVFAIPIFFVEKSKMPITLRQQICTLLKMDGEVIPE